MEQIYMQYILKHKNHDVCTLSCDMDGVYVTHITRIHDFTRMPVFIDSGRFKSHDLNRWLHRRIIPMERQAIKNVLHYNRRRYQSSCKNFMTKAYALSLSDHYWLCPKKIDLKWEDVNFFENDFSTDFGDILFGKRFNHKANFRSPDITTNGNLIKRWEQREGEHYLVKGSAALYMEEPFNEVIATKVLERLGIKHVPYSYERREDEKVMLFNVSLCPKLTNETIEMIPAWDIGLLFNKPDHVSFYQHFLDSCSRLGIHNIQEDLDKMLIFDYCIGNIDRHYHNFGILRNSETLEWKGLAPLYDHGNSLCVAHGLVSNRMDEKSITFAELHSEQIKFVKDYSIVDVSKLCGMEEEFHELFSKNEYMPQQKREGIFLYFEKRLKMFMELAGM